mgnify:CR=1 FL=1
MNPTLYAFTAFCLLLGYLVCLGVFVVGFRAGRIAEQVRSRSSNARTLQTASPANDTNSPAVDVNR